MREGPEGEVAALQPQPCWPWSLGCRVSAPSSTLAASASLSHTDAVYTAVRGAGGAGLGPVCVCNGARVGGCEGGRAERLPWHSALGVGLSHVYGEEGGGEMKNLGGKGMQAGGGVSWGTPMCAGEPGGAPELAPGSPAAFPPLPSGTRWVPLGSQLDGGLALAPWKPCASFHS